MRLLVISIISIALFVQCNSKQEIAQWRGPERNGIYPGVNLLTQWPDSGPKQVWRYSELGSAYSSAAVTFDRVYTIGTIDSISYVFSFNHFGKILWKKKLGKDWTKNWPGMRSTPTIYKGLGYAFNGLGVLYCFDADKGDVIWSKDITKDFNGRNPDFGACENLVIDGDKLFCTPAGIETCVVALNRNSGSLIWKSSEISDSSAYSNPILIETGGKKLFINQTIKSINAFDSETGAFVLEVRLKAKSHPSTPVFRNGYLFVVDGGKEGSFMLKLNENGTIASEVWRNKEVDPSQGDVVVLGDRMYGVCGEGKRLSCIDWNTGKELYSYSIKDEVATLISSDNLIFYYGLRGSFKLLKPTETSFEKVGEFFVKGGSKLHCSHPVIKDGRLYVRHDNSLFVYDIAKH